MQGRAGALNEKLEWEMHPINFSGEEERKCKKSSGNSICYKEEKDVFVSFATCAAN